MPELAEVEYFRKEWNPGLGQTVRRVHLHPQARIFRETSPVLLQRRLKGERFLDSFSHGKNLLFQFSGGGWLGGHLGMTGSLRVESVGDSFDPEKHDHLVLFLESVALVFTDPRMFGRIRFEVSSDSPPDWWLQLPPGVLTTVFTKERIVEFTGRRARTPIKTLLLDQSVFPGIGNWMADEICWRLHWHPARLSGTLSEADATELWKMVRQVSRQALKVIGDGWNDPPDSWLFNHRWEKDHQCPRPGCGGDLVRADLRGRTTCWCPVCQQEQRPA
ncbi:MAG: Fpg/Nei family DNA glycosylase [Verrucomicrobiae bacterium]|nr:Fpg/Nei family DNA glycosylase [Verrucomicrobiae bacterium]